ncbi:MAG TPA: universal stress protein [Streptosporangiaceae bacterium]|nr:universal stress protein [Streptosporangiaceae bacterium]
MTVVVGVQGHTWSRAAIQAAAQEARFRGTKLVAVAAYSTGHGAAAPAARPAAGLRTPGEERAGAEEMLQAAVLDALGQDAAGAELRVMQGGPGRTLVEAARQLGADMVVLGSPGEGAKSWLLGSQYVLRNAPCLVLVVPDPAVPAS